MDAQAIVDRFRAAGQSEGHIRTTVDTIPVAQEHAGTGRPMVELHNSFLPADVTTADLYENMEEIFEIVGEPSRPGRGRGSDESFS